MTQVPFPLCTSQLLQVRLLEASRLTVNKTFISFAEYCQISLKEKLAFYDNPCHFQSLMAMSAKDNSIFIFVYNLMSTNFDHFMCLVIFTRAP